MHTVQAPTDWNDETVLNFIGEMDDVRDHAGAVVLDFGPTRWVQPFAALVAAEAIRELREHRHANSLPLKWIKIQGAVTRAISYLGHVGFFRHAHMPYGNAPGQAPGSSTYLPFTVIRREPESDNERFGAMQEDVEEHSRRLARLIHPDEFAQDMIAYCLREIIRNVFEHAQTSECVLVAQKYVGTHIELGIADRGRGVPASMAEAGTFPSPHAALLSALEPGKTRVVQPGDHRWENSGFGLYVLSTLARSRGSFRLFSRGAAVSVDGGDPVIGDAVFPGTAVKLEVSMHDAEYFPNELHSIVEAGEQWAERRARASGSTRAIPHSRADGG